MFKKFIIPAAALLLAGTSLTTLSFTAQAGNRVITNFNGGSDNDDRSGRNHKSRQHKENDNHGQGHSDNDNGRDSEGHDSGNDNDGHDGNDNDGHDGNDND